MGTRAGQPALAFWGPARRVLRPCVESEGDRPGRSVASASGSGGGTAGEDQDPPAPRSLYPRERQHEVNVHQVNHLYIYLQPMYVQRRFRAAYKDTFSIHRINSEEQHWQGEQVGVGVQGWVWELPTLRFLFSQRVLGQSDDLCGPQFPCLQSQGGGMETLGGLFQPWCSTCFPKCPATRQAGDDRHARCVLGSQLKLTASNR